MITRISERSTDTQLTVRTDKDINIQLWGANSLRDCLQVANFFSHKTFDGVRITKGSWEAIESVWLKIWHEVSQYPKTALISVYGYSWGGGLAQVIAFRLATSGYNNVHLRVIGSVRVGNRAFAEYISTFCKSASWIEYGNDPIPLIWPWLKRVGNVTYLKKRSFPWINLNLWKDHYAYFEDQS